MEEYQMHSERQSAVVRFSSHEFAKLALAGNALHYVISLFRPASIQNRSSRNRVESVIPRRVMSKIKKRTFISNS